MALAFLALSILTVCPATAFVPNLDLIDPAVMGGTTRFAPYDTVRVLWVFARFTDGAEFDHCDPRGWPDPDALPSWSADLLEDPARPLSPTWTPSNPKSLTSFFWNLSDDGTPGSEHHLIIGEVLEDVVVMPYTIEHYWDTYGAQDADHYASLDLLAKLDDVNAHNVDFSEFDYDENDEVDYIFVYYRSPRTQSANPVKYINLLDTSRYSGWSQLFNTGESVAYDEVTISAESGALLMQMSVEIENELYYVRNWGWSIAVATHEYAHDLDIPQHHAANYGFQGGGLRVGPELASAPERLDLGWIDPVDVGIIDLGSVSAPFDTTITLTDASTTGYEGYAIIKTTDPRQYFILEAHDSTGMAGYQSDPTPAPDCEDCPAYFNRCRSDGHPSGLLVWHVFDEYGDLTELDFPYAQPTPATPPLDLESVRGLYDPTTGAPDPVEGQDELNFEQRMDIEEDVRTELASHSDMFGPSTSNVFGPFTNPSTNLYDSDGSGNGKKQSIYSGITFYNITWTVAPGGSGPGTGELAVTLRFDGATPLTAPLALPSDMIWRGDVRLASDVEVASGNTLTIDPGSRVIVAAEQDLHQTGADPGASEVLVNGTLESNGSPTSPVVFTSSRDDAVLTWVTSGETAPAAPGDWFGIRKGASATFDVSDTEVKYASGAVNYAVSVFPDLASGGLPGFTFSENLNDVTFDRDVSVAAGVTRTVPSGLKVGFAPADAQNASTGLDPARVELIVEPTGQLVLGGTPSEVVLQSTRRTPAPGDWYGVRLPGSSSLSATNARIRHAASALVWESATWPNFGTIAAGVTFENVQTWLGLERDHVVPSGQTVTIPAGWSIGFSANHDEANLGIDATRVEILCDGNLVLAGTSGQPVVLRSSKSGDLGSWYGIRLNDYAKILTTTQFGVIQEAGGALSVEGAAAAAGIPNFSTFSGKLSFAGNRSDICFDRDVTIASAQTVTIPPGWRIGFRSGTEEVSGGISTLPEFIVDGVLLAGSTGAARVVFTSNAKTADIQNVGWHGVRYKEPHYLFDVAPPGYGYARVPMTDSKIESAEIAGARAAISIETICGPALTDVNFIGSGDDPVTPIHILLKNTDVVVPYGKSWSLNAGTQVVAENSSSTDYFIDDVALGESGLGDLIIQGSLKTFGNVALGRVKFGPRTPNNSTAADWGGLFFDLVSSDCVVDSARVSHAPIPITATYPDSLVVKNTEIRHFAEMAVWAYRGIGDSLVLEGNDIRRGAGAGGMVGQTGVKLEKCEMAKVLNNRIELKGTLNPLAVGGAAIWVSNSKDWCVSQGSPGSGEVRIERNTLRGERFQQTIPDTAVTVPKWSGIKLEWGCGPGQRTTKIIANQTIDDWPRNGLDFFQSSDVQVLCNELNNNVMGVTNSRNSSVTFPEGIRFEKNDFTGTTGANRPVVQTDHVPSFGFGPGVIGLTGGNRVDISSNEVPPDRHFFLGVSQINSGALNLQGNLWKRAGVVLTNPADITTHIAFTESVSVDPDDALTSDPECGSGETGNEPMMRASKVGEEDPLSTDLRTILGSAQPVENALVSIWPSPSGDHSTIRFAVGYREVGSVSVQVFDVAGRRVRTILDRKLDSGTFEVRWDGRDDGGRRSSSGVYFVQLRGASKSDVKKLVRLN